MSIARVRSLTTLHTNNRLLICVLSLSPNDHSAHACCKVLDPQLLPAFISASLQVVTSLPSACPYYYFSAIHSLKRSDHRTWSPRRHVPDRLQISHRSQNTLGWLLQLQVNIIPLIIIYDLLNQRYQCCWQWWLAICEQACCARIRNWYKFPVPLWTDRHFTIRSQVMHLNQHGFRFPGDHKTLLATEHLSISSSFRTNFE